MKVKMPWKALLIGLITAFTLSLHYMMFPFPHWVHLIHRRLCYIPILLAGLWYGFPGGLIVSGTIAIATLPLALRYAGPFWGNQDFIEITFYLGLGILTGVLVDRRERERSRREALQHQLNESERLASIGRMAAGVAHEVRTPLGSIQGAAEILAEDYPSDHPRRPFFDILTQETGRLKAVVQDFLDMGRPISVMPGMWTLRKAAASAWQSVASEAEKAGVQLSTDVQEKCQVWADELRLHQALGNLLRNAIQASPPGGVVRIAAGAEDGGCRITVEDEGPGLPPGDGQRIFEPFYTRRKEGTGLGLALVRQIAEAHGGWVHGESRPEGGARFVLWFPSPPAAASAGKGQ